CRSVCGSRLTHLYPVPSRTGRPLDETPSAISSYSSRNELGGGPTRPIGRRVRVVFSYVESSITRSVAPGNNDGLSPGRVRAGILQRVRACLGKFGRFTVQLADLRSLEHPHGTTPRLDDGQCGLERCWLEPARHCRS